MGEPGDKSSRYVSGQHAQTSLCARIAKRSLVHIKVDGG